jgi:predicted MPP superfamily phosphohydrolase
MITMGEKGIALFEKGKPFRTIPTMAREVYDVCGAGDTVIATLTLALAAGVGLLEASALANYAAGLEVGKLGVATVSAQELLDRLLEDWTMEADALLPSPASHAAFWLLWTVLLHLLDFIYCRVVLHEASQVRGWLRALPWMLFLFAGSYRLLRDWDFEWGTWGDLGPFTKAWCVVALGVSLVLWVRQTIWFLFSRKPVRFHLTHHTKVRSPHHPPFRFLSRIGIRNQLYDLSLLEYDLEVPGWPLEWSGLTVTHLSDVHHSRYIHDAYLSRVHQAVVSWRSDLILFTGDFIGGHEDLLRGFRWLKGFHAEMGLWAVLGNHEGWTDPVSAARGLKDAGIGLLANQAVLFHRMGSTLALLGADDLWTGGKDASALEHAASKADARILLAHQPDHFPLARKLKAHLQLSGHCHGGQVCLPGGIPLIAPSRFGVRYAGGFYREASSVMFASRGIGADPPIRTFCPPELVKLRLLSPERYQGKD